MFRRNEFRPQPAECAACAAKDQTIALLADVVDWHRAQHGLSMQSLQQVLEPRPVFVPGVGSDPEKKWASDDEEELTAALESGTLGVEEAEKALAALQALNTEVEIQRP